MRLIIITIEPFLCNYNGIQLSHSDYYPNGKDIKTPADSLIRKTIRGSPTLHQLQFLSFSLHYIMPFKKQHTHTHTHTHTQTTCVFSTSQQTAIILTRGGKKGGRDAAWCNPSEGHHASRLNNVFPMPCQTSSRL